MRRLVRTRVHRGSWEHRRTSPSLSAARDGQLVRSNTDVPQRSRVARSLSPDESTPRSTKPPPLLSPSWLAVGLRTLPAILVPI